MAQVVGHLDLEELQAGYRRSEDATLARHYQVIWLLAQGRTCPEVAELTSFALRWVEQLLARYNAFGPSSLGDRRRGNGAAPTVLTPAMLAALRERLKRPPDDGGVWTARKVAAFMAAELGRHVAEQRGWEALRAIGWTIQSPRPRHARGGDARGAGGVQKKLAEAVAEEAERHPGATIEAFATDEHRIGLKPILRRVWAPRGQRPIARGHHRYQWFYVTAFVSPATGESFWYLSTGVDKELFEDTLALFAREAGAGRDRIVLLVLDGAGWHTAPASRCPRASASSTCRPTPPSCNRPRRFGSTSTNRSSTSTSKPSKTSMPSWRSGASPSKKIATSSEARQASTGGRTGPTRPNHPETV